MEITAEMKTKIQDELQHRIDDGEWTESDKKEYLNALLKEKARLTAQIEMISIGKELYDRNPIRLDVKFEYENNDKYREAEKNFYMFKFNDEIDKADGQLQSTQIQIDYLQRKGE